MASGQEKNLNYSHPLYVNVDKQLFKDACLFLAKKDYNFFEIASCVTSTRIARQSVIFCLGHNMSINLVSAVA